jgi:hypothetical protein
MMTCCKCGATGSVHNRHYRGGDEHAAIVPISWLCAGCKGRVCINCALTIPGSQPIEIMEETLCSLECALKVCPPQCDRCGSSRILLRTTFSRADAAAAPAVGRFRELAIVVQSRWTCADCDTPWDGSFQEPQAGREGLSDAPQMPPWVKTHPGGD